MKTVLIFAHECAPYNRQASTIGAQRAAQFAKYLPAAGWRAIVICCDAKKAYTANKEDIPAIVNNARQQLKSSDPHSSVIIATPSLFYSGVIDRAWNSLIKRNSDGSLSDKNKLASVLRKPITFLKLFTGDYSEAWQPVAIAAADAIVQQVHIDVCISEHGPDASLYAARSFSKKYSVPWVADFRDPILMPFKGISSNVYKTYSKYLLRSAKATVNVTAYWTELDKAHFGLPAITVTNGFDVDEFKATSVYDKGDKFVISYLGSYKYFQDVDLFLKAYKNVINRIDESDRHLLSFLYRGSKWKEISEIADKNNVKVYVNVERNAERADAIKIMQQSNMLLLLSAAPKLTSSNFYKKGFYPGKVFEYFGAQRPILCIPGDNGVLDELIKETQTGISIANEEDIASYILSCFENWKNGVAVAYSPDINIVNQYSRKNQTKKLGSILDMFSRA